MTIQITKSAWQTIGEIIHKTSNTYDLLYSAKTGFDNKK